MPLADGLAWDKEVAGSIPAAPIFSPPSSMGLGFLAFNQGKRVRVSLGVWRLCGRGAAERTSGSQPEDREFESRRPYHLGA